jgi:hypothetical protein
MGVGRVIRIKTILLASLLFAVGAEAQQSATPQGNFKIVDNPGGGQYLYGPLTGKGTMPDAIVYVLRQVHGYFGDRPEVGKFFQSRDGSSVATFFTAMAKKQGNKPIQGLLIVAVASDGSGSAAMLYDEKSRFAESEPVMMQALSRVWHPAGAAGGGSQPAASPAHHGSVAPLVETTGGDRSAAISLPAGWKITTVNGGALTAVGSNGENIYLGLLYQGLPPQGPDLFANFVNASNQYRSTHGLQPATYTGIAKTTISPQAVQVLFTVDLHDGVGPRKGSVRVDSWGPRAFSVSGSNIPERFADEENATMLAVIRSYKQNTQMIAQMQQGVMNRIHADADRINALAAASNARRESSTAAFNQHMDNLDRSSKINQDYILDRSVVRDTQYAERGTVSNSYADSLVRSNPERFQIVANQDLIKGKDY